MATKIVYFCGGPAHDQQVQLAVGLRTVEVEVEIKAADAAAEDGRRFTTRYSLWYFDPTFQREVWTEFGVPVAQKGFCT